MGLRRTASRIVEQLPMGARLLETVRHQQVQRDWSTVHRVAYQKSTLSVYTTVGLGDVMIAKQICESFLRFCELEGDPALGRIVVVAGAWPPHFRLKKGDHNIYWWWSQNGRDDWLDVYLADARVKPDVVACLSNWSLNYAKRLGARTIYLPLAVGEHFRCLHLTRSGVGYAGSKRHKDQAQMGVITEPFRDRADFEWVDNLKTPAELNQFYNRKQIVLGMTESFQERAGMVNNRVFEVLATGTPFLIHRHRAVEEVLGQAYPFQAGTAEETRELAERMLADYPRYATRFEEYSNEILARHTYHHRWDTLLAYLKTS